MIKSLNYTIMKKLYFYLLLLPFWGLGTSSACAQSVKLNDSNFDTGAVTFTVDVGAATPTWVLVEYTTDPSPTSAIMSRATFTDESINPPSAGTLAAEGRGFLLTSSATITAKLKDVSGRFSWCGYAFDVPPKAVAQPDSSYQLYGTPPFRVNGVTLADDVKTFGPGTCIESFTDFTYNPEGRIISLFSAGDINDAGIATIVGYAPATNPANATEASGGEGNIMYEWRRTGTSSKTLANSNSFGYDISDDPTNYDTPGTYYFTRYAKDGTGKTTLTASGGQYTLWVAPTPPTAGTATWAYGGLIWSDALKNPCTCAQVSDTKTSPAQYVIPAPDVGYLYNYMCMEACTATLCPHPWRVPNKADGDTMSPYAASFYAEYPQTYFTDGVGQFALEKTLGFTFVWSTYRSGTNRYGLKCNSTYCYWQECKSSFPYGAVVRCVARPE
jgi:hypothetical protein